MKQPLWILNSSLLVIFLLILLFNNVLKQEPTAVRIKPPSIKEIEKKKLPIVVNLERIYTHDLFDTFVAIEKKAVQQTFVTPIPPPRSPVITPPPEFKKTEFVPNLNITIKGIIISSDDSNSVAMIADETNKEAVYHLGDRIKDGQLIKLSRNKVVILRANGQQEIFLLRKPDIPEPPPPDKWLYTIKKIDDQNFEINPKEFTREIQTLGQLLENLSLNTAYKNGNVIGIKVGKLDQASIGLALGLNQNDILSSINDIDVSQIKNRIKIYDKISQTEKGDSIKLSLKRADQDITLNYKLSKIEKPKKQTFIQPAAPGAPQPPAPPIPPPGPGQFKIGPGQKRDEMLRRFKNIHYAPRQQNVIQDIRGRLRENMRQRRLNRRVR